MTTKRTPKVSYQAITTLNVRTITRIYDTLIVTFDGIPDPIVHQYQTPEIAKKRYELVVSRMDNPIRVNAH